MPVRKHRIKARPRDGLTGQTPLAPRPSDEKVLYPWRVKLREWIYIRNFEGRLPAQVMSGILLGSFPHVIVRDSAGTYWRVPQLHISLDPITER